MRVPSFVATSVAALGLVLPVLAASCSGGAPSPGQDQPALPTPTSEDSATLALLEGVPTTDPIDLDFDSAATDAAAAEIEATIAFWLPRAERDPRDYVALNTLGNLYLRRAQLLGDVADFARARAAYEQSIDSNRSRNLGGLTGLAHVSIFTHRFEDARSLANEVLAIKPDDVAARWLLGDAQLALGEYDAAYRTFTDPLAFTGTLPSHARVAFIEALRGNLAAAELQWQLAIAADTRQLPEQTAWVHTQTAAFYLDAGRFEEARTHLDLALAALPGDPAALAGRANLAIALAQFDEAIRIYEHLVERRPEPGFAIALGELYEATGQPDRAAEQYALVLAIDQIQQAAGIATDLQIARFLVAHGDDPEAALAAAMRAYEARPGIEAADTLAWAHYRVGDYDTAARYSVEARRLGTKRPAFLAHAGLIEYARGNLNTAAELLREAHAIDPRYSIAEAPLVVATLEAIESAQVSR